jgi:hypothetical protein
MLGTHRSDPNCCLGDPENGMFAWCLTELTIGIFMRAVFVCLSVAVLGACSTGVNGERVWGMPGSPAWKSTADPETIRAYYEKFCIAAGYETNTQEMDSCVERTMIEENKTRSGSSSGRQAQDGSKERRAEIRKRSNESLQETFDRYKN